MKEQELKKVIIRGSLGLILVGSVVAVIGFSLSGFNFDKFRSDDKKWHQVITVPRNFK
ncbi:hypothetical protein I6N95_19335 [Vagococcus sp. BWB3-3]|uniref:Uncharacterized protein n=1 Tax=Vagococcus allomyrinae TaxID=2794353 RepID=A0A940PGL4_9ENTE|nr:hypothetical protein [Vagococcus allomyrinae]MBP1043176.1 hypothetical protein [Vagococcus allomyrinae]